MSESNSTSSSFETSSKKGRKTRMWVIIIVAIVLVLYLGIGGYAASELTKVGDHDQYDKTPATFGLEFQEVTFPAVEDDLQIAAWYIPNAESAKAIVLVHGRDASKQNAISGTIVDLAASLHNSGFAVLMIDLRGHGDSEGERYSFGFYERRDILGASRWLQDQGFESGKIGVLGMSLGGGSTILAAVEDPAIGVIVLDSTFSDMGPLIEAKWVEESGLPKFFLPGVYLMNRIMYGYHLAGIKPVEEITQFSPRPVFILHCREDKDVAFSHAEELLEAVPGAGSWFMDDCDHAEIYRDYPEEYENRVIPFFKDSL